MRVLQQVHLCLPARRVSGRRDESDGTLAREHKGHTPKSPSMHFDEVFTEQIVKTGKIEESRTIRRFFAHARSRGSSSPG